MTHPCKRLSRSAALALALALPIAGGAREARAADSATAQVLFDEAKKLMAVGKHAEACPKLEESQKLDPGVGTQYNLASCYEQVGKTASAWSMFIEVAAVSKAAGQQDREKVARQRAAALEPKLMRLAVKVPEGAPAEMQVLRDGKPMGQAQWGTAVPVDPGKHTVTAEVPGRVPFTATVELAEPGSTAAVEITPPDTWAPVAKPPPGPRVTVQTAQPAAPPVEEPELERKSMPLMFTGIGLATVGTVIGLWGLGELSSCAGLDPEDPTLTPELQFQAIACEEDRSSYIAGVVIGGGMIAGGIPLMVYGGQKVQVAPKPKGTATLLIGPTSVAVRWTM